MNVWSGIIAKGILVPYFFPVNLNTERYQEFLMFNLIPSLDVVFPFGTNPDIPQERVWLRQGGSPPHFGINVTYYLSEIFPNLPTEGFRPVR